MLTAASLSGVPLNDLHVLNVQVSVNYESCNLARELTLSCENNQRMRVTKQLWHDLCWVYWWQSGCAYHPLTVLRTWSPKRERLQDGLVRSCLWTSTKLKKLTPYSCSCKEGTAHVLILTCSCLISGLVNRVPDFHLSCISRQFPMV